MNVHKLLLALLGLNLLHGCTASDSLTQAISPHQQQTPSEGDSAADASSDEESPEAASADISRPPSQEPGDASITDIATEQADPVPSILTSPPFVSQKPNLSTAEREGWAIRLLNRGRYETAAEELRLVLQQAPAASSARFLLGQLETDPITYFGPGFCIYEVRKNQSLSDITQLFYGNAMMFPALARYNNLLSPQELTLGKALKIPLDQAKRSCEAAKALLAERDQQATTRRQAKEEQKRPQPPVTATREATEKPASTSSAIASKDSMDKEELYQTLSQLYLNKSYRELVKVSDGHRDLWQSETTIKRWVFESRVALAREYHQQDLPLAELLLDSAERLDVHNEDSRLKALYSSSHQLIKAESAYQESVKLYKKQAYPDALKKLEASLHLSPEHKQARAMQKTATQEWALNLVLQGDELLQKKKVKEALSAYSKAQSLIPNDGFIRDKMKVALERMR